jgi:hypothetical protein
MAKDEFTVLDERGAVSVPAIIRNDRVQLKPADLERALDWELKPEGFCQGSTCFPTPDGGSVVADGGVDLVEFARLLDRPIALDADERAAYLGTSAGDRAEQLTSLEAPDFTLPGLDGQLRSLSDYRGRKILLVAYASW